MRPAVSGQPQGVRAAKEVSFRLEDRILAFSRNHATLSRTFSGSLSRPVGGPKHDLDMHGEAKSQRRPVNRGVLLGFICMS